MPRLPISGLEVRLRLPSGADDLMLLESRFTEPETVAALIARLDVTRTGTDWGAVPVPDLEAALLILRQVLIGDHVRADVRCSCRRRVDIEFSAGEFLASVVPRIPRYVAASDLGWFALRESDVTFRIPTVGDQIAAQGAQRADGELERRCVRPAPAAPAYARKVQRALDAMAPSLSRSLEGVCPDCGAKLSMYFDVYGFVLRELRYRAESLYRDIHVIAQSYHWHERQILAMSSVRRRQYAEMILEARSA